MHILVVNLQLKEMNHDQFLSLADELAPAFAGVPGLESKVWLSSPAKNTYGGVYTFRDRAACEAYMRSDLFEAVRSHPNFTNITANEFEVLAAPTSVTSGRAITHA
jgi:quinol monooxygenase YgiN